MVDREDVNLFKIYRKKKELSIVELAEKLKVSQQWLAQVELGEIEPTEEEMEMLKDALM